jgi:hypothetical protein
VHGDVVKITKSILEALESGKELFTSFHRPFCPEQCGEELRCVPQLLRLDAELVPAVRVEP